MKVLLVFPPQLGEERYGKFARAGSYLPPLGLLYLAAAIEKNHEVRIVDGSTEHVTEKTILQIMKEWQPQVVGITSHTPTFYRAIHICKIAKELNPEIKTVIGGPHATACPDDTIRSEYVDVAVVGEGEKILINLLAAFQDKKVLDGVKGIYYKKGTSIISNGPEERIINLDSLPLPARHLINLKDYRPSVMHYKKLPAFSVMCGRGCPFGCTFCSCAKVFKRKVTVRSKESVFDEIKYLITNYGAREIMFWDDTFAINKNWVLGLCELLKTLNITWSCWMRVDQVSEDMLKKMSESGCWHISYGVESGNQKVLDTIKKGFTLQQVRDAFRWTHNTGMEARGTFILGLPSETWDTMMDTINLAIEIKSDYAQFQLLTPFPGTELWDVVNEFGETPIKDLSKYTIWFPVFVPKGLTQEELMKALKLAYRKFYFRPNYIVHTLKKMGSLQDLKRNLIGVTSLFEFFGSKKNG